MYINIDKGKLSALIYAKFGTKAKFAYHLDIDEASLHQSIRKAHFKYENALRYANALGCSISDFASGGEEP